MNRKLGMIASVVTAIGVAGFALSMILKADSMSYFSSMIIAWGFIPMTVAFAVFAQPNRRAAGVCGAAFSVVYAVLVLLVYYAQLTVVAGGNLGSEASSLLDFKKFGLFFSYDLLGYALMALSTFFTGLSIQPKSLDGRWLKGLLLAHGILFIGCVLMPLLGIFHPGMPGGDLTGTLVLEFWCLYFLPVCVLSFRHFWKMDQD